MTLTEIGGDSLVVHGGPVNPYPVEIHLPNFGDWTYQRQSELCLTALRMMGDMNFDDEQHLIVAMSADTRGELKRLTDSFYHNGYKLSVADEADLRRAVQALQQLQQ
jgi:hypothetical protein